MGTGFPFLRTHVIFLFASCTPEMCDELNNSHVNLYLNK